MSTALQNLLGTAFIVVIVTASLQLSGCGTYASWTPREAEAAPEYSCASGYYNCRLRESENRSRDDAEGGSTGGSKGGFQ